ncbi:MAG: hypothetical protein P1V81_16980 [Planctomycetota bacterium]|nr:hypothetical protein [Planctomycetota bacterium]
MRSSTDSQPPEGDEPQTALTETGEFTGLDPELLEQLPTFELFFKTFGFKRVHGRVWGLLVLAGQPLSSKEIAAALGISTGLTSTTINELTEWGALRSSFDPERRCHLHGVVGNTMSIVATILRRREQVAMAHFKRSANQTLEFIKKKYGAADPRVLTLRSIIGSCEIAEAVMQLVMSSVERALGDSQSLLSRALTTALKLSTALPGIGRKGRGAKSTDGELAPVLERSIERYIEEEQRLAQVRQERREGGANLDDESGEEELHPEQLKHHG